MSSRRKNDGLSKRCECARRKWLTCSHAWHLDFFHKRTAHLYGGRAKHRYSLDVIAQARHEEPPRSKGAAEALADVIRADIRAGTFRDPNRPEAPPAPDPAALRERVSPSRDADQLHLRARFVRRLHHQFRLPKWNLLISITVNEKNGSRRARNVRNWGGTTRPISS